MGLEMFYVAVKSTVDKLAAEAADRVTEVYPEISPVPSTLDAPSDLSAVMTGDVPAIVWSIQRFGPAKRDPLYELVFMIGVRATADPNGEILAALLSVIYSELPIGARVEIKNYSGEEVTELPGETGTIFVQDTMVQEQLYDGQAALRMVTVSAAVLREI